MLAQARDECHGLGESESCTFVMSGLGSLGVKFIRAIRLKSHATQKTQYGDELEMDRNVSPTGLCSNLRTRSK